MPNHDILKPLVEGPRVAPLPEQRLLIAILVDAITCFEKNYPLVRRSGNRLFREAEDWLMSDKDHGPFSFEYICAVLGLDPGAVRCRLRRRMGPVMGAEG